MDHLHCLGSYAAALRLEDIPEEVVEAAKLCVLDTVGGAVGARTNRQALSVLDAYTLIEGAGTAPVWGGGTAPTPLRAGFFNAMLGHTLELDDVHVRSKTHIGTVVIPAAWSLAEHLRADGKRFLEAVVCGYEVMSRIGMGFGVTSHREIGWHATSTAGTFGAAAAGAKLLGLSAEQTANALGLAGTQSFGLWAFLEDGATSKTLHPARAAMTGMESALLAGAGMTGPVHILNARDGGLFQAMSDEYDLSRVCDGLGSRYETLHMDKKPYPCCRSAHCAIDAALHLRKKYDLTDDRVATVVVKTYRVGYMQVGCSATSLDPVLPSDAKFSTPYVVACALLDGEVGLRHFEPETICREDIRASLKKVTVVEDENYTRRYPQNWGCELIITTTDGKEFAHEVPDASGSVSHPMSADAVMQKAVSSAESILGGATHSLFESILHIDAAPALPRIEP